MKKYEKLSDCPFFKEGDAIEIWYAKPKFFADVSLRDASKYDRNKPEKTHVFLGSIGIPNNKVDLEFSQTEMLDFLFMNLQGERWCVNGEANELIQKEGVSHTSFSVGDMIRFCIPTIHAEIRHVDYVCNNVGWLRF